MRHGNPGFRDVKVISKSQDKKEIIAMILRLHQNKSVLESVVQLASVDGLLKLLCLFWRCKVPVTLQEDYHPNGSWQTQKRCPCKSNEIQQSQVQAVELQFG